MDATSQARPRWFHPTPGRFVLVLLAVEVLLWLSDRFGWLGWHKGYAVLDVHGELGVAMMVMLVWFGVALILRRRFQFSIRSLLLLTVTVAIPFSWLAAKMQIAKRQKAAAAEIVKLGQVWVRYDYECDDFGREIQAAKPPEPGWLRNLLGADFFSGVAMVRLDNYVPRDGGWTAESGELENPEEWWVSKTKGVDDGLQHLRDLPRLRWLILARSYVTDNGLKNLEGLSQLQSLDLTVPKSRMLG